MAAGVPMISKKGGQSMVEAICIASTLFILMPFFERGISNCTEAKSGLHYLLHYLLHILPVVSITRFPRLSKDDTWFGTEQGALNRYIVTMYWSVTTMTTTGYGDLHPANALDMGIDTIYMLFNLALTSYIIGTMSTLLGQIADGTMKYRIAVQSVMDFAARYHLPPAVNEAMLANLELKFRTGSFCQKDIMANLPKSLRAVIAQHRFLPTVEEVYLFKRTSTEFLHQLVIGINAEYYPPGVEIIAHNESPSQFFLTASGSVELRTMNGGVSEVLMTMGQDKIIGEVGVLHGIPQPFAVWTRRSTCLLLLDRTVYESIVNANPADGQIVRENLNQYLREANDGRFAALAPDIQDLPASPLEIQDPPAAPPEIQDFSALPPEIQYY